MFGKTKGGGEGREGKGGKRGERTGKRKDKIFFFFPCLVCKRKLEGNTPYILVGLTISTLSFSSQFGRKEYSEPWRNLFPSFSFSSQQSLLTKQKNLFPFLPFFFFSSQIPPNQTKGNYLSTELFFLLRFWFSLSHTIYFMYQLFVKYGHFWKSCISHMKEYIYYGYRLQSESVN